MTRMMCTWFAPCLLAFTAACAPDRSEPQAATMDLETLLDSHAQARGGKEVVESVRTVSVELEITEPGFTVTGRYRASRDGWMRIDVFAGGERVFTEALGPNGGWQMFGDGTIADLSPEGETALRRGIASNLYGLHELPGLGYELEFIGPASRTGSAYWELEMTAPDGFSQHLFFDKGTFLIASDIRTAALHPDIDSTQSRQETFYSDYGESGGLLYARKSEKKNLDTGEIMQTTITTDRRINEELAPAQFRRPAGQ